MSVRPITLTAAAAVQALEGLLVIGAGIFVGFETIVGEPRDLPSAVALAVIAVLAGALMVVVGRGLLRRLRWSRSPAVLTQIFVLIVAVPMVRGGQWAIGVPLVCGAVAGLVALLAPASGRALSDGGPDPARPGQRRAPERAQGNSAESGDAPSPGDSK